MPPSVREKRNAFFSNFSAKTLSEFNESNKEAKFGLWYDLCFYNFLFLGQTQGK